MTGLLWLLLPLLAAMGWSVGRARALALAGDPSDAGGRIELHSLPGHYGQFVLIWAALPPLAVLVLATVFGGALVDGWVASQIETLAALEGDDARGEVVRRNRELYSHREALEGLKSIGQMTKVFVVSNGGIGLAGLIASFKAAFA